jgi:hypothetical protein
MKDLLLAMQGDDFWEPYLNGLVQQDCIPVSLHLAILGEPYLSRILARQKTIESRFSVDRRTPYGRVQENDIILLKRTSGPIVGIGQVSEVQTYDGLDAKQIHTIREKFECELGIDDPSFWEGQQRSSFATLVRLTHVRSIGGIELVKRDRRAWVVLQQRTSQLSYV